jgi:threonylcarbamoyladenosine tRNA methylthiotransferase MtaB
MLNKASKNKTTKLIVVCGCFSQASKIDIPKVNIILGNKYKNEIPKLISQFKDEKIIKVENLMLEKKFEHSICDFKENTRAFIKIQDGCNFFCSYCLIPFVRGKQRSLEPQIIISDIKQLVKQGYKEIVLTGVNTAGYKYEKTNFYQLLKLINEISGNFRIRISSLEPFQIDKKIIDLISNNKRFCQVFHLCLQSANNKVLESMNRKYSIEKFISLCKYIKSKNKNASITTDYIVGFPNETIEMFNDSLKNLDKICFSDMHIFPYSDREGTAASKIKHIVSDTEKKKRYFIIKNKCETYKNEYLKSFINKTVSVLFEKSDTSVQAGHSQYFFKVNVISKKKLQNQLLNVKIIKIKNNELIGIL